ncbi:hypothetical protein D4764_03G0012480 [Takifugu flavidus]|uniref:Uncharacterized protein n=1 Tax=Takifugu flavidus TaxID=433684 RepID=A0A5C6NE47_9TELE|nr:hypothetical protein D4764_03G0012480 [Takifugu flavidus]
MAGWVEREERGEERRGEEERRGGEERRGEERTGTEHRNTYKNTLFMQAAGRRLPADYQERVAIFPNPNQERVAIFPNPNQKRAAIFCTYCLDKITAPSHITNMDEIPLTFNIPLTHKVEKKRSARWRYAQRGTRSRRSPRFSAAMETDRALDDGRRTLLHKDYEAAAGKLCHHMRVDCRRMGYDTVFMYWKSFHKINAEPEPVSESDSDD